MKKKFLLKSMIFLVIFIMIKKILNFFELEFMNWVVYSSVWTFLIMLILGILYYVFMIKKKWLRYIIYFLIIALIIVVLIGCKFSRLFMWYERITEVNNVKVVEKYFDFEQVPGRAYYKYYNIFIRGKNEILKSSMF